MHHAAGTHVRVLTNIRRYKARIENSFKDGLLYVSCLSRGALFKHFPPIFWVAANSLLGHLHCFFQAVIRAKIVLKRATLSLGGGNFRDSSIHNY